MKKPSDVLTGFPWPAENSGAREIIPISVLRVKALSTELLLVRPPYVVIFGHFFYSSTVKFLRLNILNTDGDLVRYPNAQIGVFENKMSDYPTMVLDVPLFERKWAELTAWANPNNITYIAINFREFANCIKQSIPAMS